MHAGWAGRNARFGFVVAVNRDNVEIFAENVQELPLWAFAGAHAGAAITMTTVATVTMEMRPNFSAM